jgi:hypothetical protein
VKLWHERTDRPAPDQPSETDLIAYARAHVTSPGAHALLDEVERGRARKTVPSGELHAFAVSPDDAAFIRVMGGPHFPPSVSLTLPSGKAITGAEMRLWAENQEQQ